jgi:hypothetical protein
MFLLWRFNIYLLSFNSGLKGFAEGKYHNKCLNAFKYDTQKTKKECETIDLAMIFLVQELGYAAFVLREIND